MIPYAAYSLPILWIAILNLVLCVDRVSKWAVMSYCPVGRSLGAWLSIQPMFNTGISLGIATKICYANQIFLVVAVLVSIYLVFCAICRPRGRYAVWAYGLLLGGALSNCLDRLLYGAVFDFIMLHWAYVCWPIFNIADVAIVLGTLLLILE